MERLAALFNLKTSLIRARSGSYRLEMLQLASCWSQRLFFLQCAGLPLILRVVINRRTGETTGGSGCRSTLLD